MATVPASNEGRIVFRLGSEGLFGPRRYRCGAFPGGMDHPWGSCWRAWRRRSAPTEEEREIDRCAIDAAASRLFATIRPDHRRGNGALAGGTWTDLDDFGDYFCARITGAKFARRYPGSADSSFVGASTDIAGALHGRNSRFAGELDQMATLLALAPVAAVASSRSLSSGAVAGRDPARAVLRAHRRRSSEFRHGAPPRAATMICGSMQTLAAEAAFRMRCESLSPQRPGDGSSVRCVCR